VGYVPAENFVGRAEFLFFSTDGTAGWWRFWRWLPAMRFDRIFRVIE
jgi:signal peptidase I